MASEVDIANLALGHLGDRATVSSFNPPEGSAQAEHCARFYPIARDLTLEAHEWGFATVRADLALLTDTPPPGFQFVYALPQDCRNVIDLINPFAPVFFPVDERYGRWMDNARTLDATPYELETRADGTGVIYTNLENAMIRYVRSITDTTKFSAQFVDAVSWLLAAYLAGPVIKGETGAQMGSACMKAYQLSLAAAATNDANNRRRSPAQSQRPADWIANR
jgi:hypothetical protein